MIKKIFHKRDILYIREILNWNGYHNDNFKYWYMRLKWILNEKLLWRENVKRKNKSGYSMDLNWIENVWLDFVGAQWID